MHGIREANEPMSGDQLNGSNLLQVTCVPRPCLGCIMHGIREANKPMFGDHGDGENLPQVTCVCVPRPRLGASCMAFEETNRDQSLVTMEIGQITAPCLVVVPVQIPSPSWVEQGGAS